MVGMHAPIRRLRDFVDFTTNEQNLGRLRWTMGFLALAYLVLAGAGWWLVPGPAWERAVEVVAGITVALAGVFFRRNPLRAVVLTVAVVWCEALGSLPLHGQFGGSEMLVFPALVFAAGLVLGEWSAVAIAVASGLCIPVAALAHRWWHDVSIGFGADDLRALLVEEIILAVSTYLTWSALRSHRAVLQESESLRARYADVLENSPDVMMSFEVQTGVVLSCNATVRRVLGYDKEAVIGRVMYDFLDEDSVRRCHEHLPILIEQGAISDLELRVRAQSGAYVDVLINSIGVRDATGRVTVGRSVLRDITERRQAEAALRQSEERFRLAMEATSDGLWDWDIATDHVYFSPGYYRLLGYAPGEFPMTGETWTHLVHPDDRARAARANQECIDNVRPGFEVEFRMQAKDGTWRWILGRGTAVSRDERGRARRMIGTHVEITERKQAEEDRLVMSKLESTGILAGGIAHDFNNLLTVILLGLDSARMARPGSADLVGALDDVAEAARSAQDLAGQLLTFAKGSEPVRRPARIDSLVQQSIKLALSGSSVNAQVSLPEDLWAAEIDPSQMGQAFRALILNAREAMPNGGRITIEAANVVLDEGHAPPALRPGDYLRLRFADEGVGIAPEVLTQVFDPYFSTKQRGSQKGMGLGLTICHTVIQKHGGMIHAESPPGSGAVFTVYLPALRVSVPRESAPPAVQPLATAAAGCLLVMDDEKTIQKTLTLVLGTMGFEVVVAVEGQEAVNHYAQARNEGRRFDAVLLDLTVRNGLGGAEALRLLRELDPGVRAIAMSGYTDSDAIRDHRRFGFQAALSKPFTATTLSEVLADVLRS
jgi:PAS domain S-box-containing protein